MVLWGDYGKARADSTCVVVFIFVLLSGYFAVVLFECMCKRICLVRMYVEGCLQSV